MSTRTTQESGRRDGVGVACPAKVNLYLRILAREDTGYHQIETLLQAVGLHDRVTAHAAGSGIRLKVVRGPTAPELGDLAAEAGEDENNTVTRAARAFYEATGIAPAVSLVLTKSIPAGTGLGGASTDAAGTLAALNALHGRPLEPGRLIEIGGTIGADVPFFCSGHATALAWGRGDRLLNCPPPPPATIVIAVPEVRIATADAYRDIASKLDLPAPPMRIPDLVEGGWPAISALQVNDFEAGAFARSPVLARTRATLESAGAMIARMTGSGSAIFGVFTDPGRARAGARRAADLSGIRSTFTAPTLAVMPRAVRESARQV